MAGVGTSTAQVRAERDQNANGRMYYLRFTASDGLGGSCSSLVLVGVPPDQGGQTMPVGEGELYVPSQVIRFSVKLKTVWFRRWVAPAKPTQEVAKRRSSPRQVWGMPTQRAHTLLF
jgi:hypothetical protein